MGLIRSRLGRRLLRAVAVALIVLLLAFALVRMVPGDPARTILGDSATPEAVEALRSRMGLDGSVADQLVGYLSGLARGDLGDSLATGQPVAEVIARSLPVTLWLIAVTAIVMVALALPIGVAVAVRHGGWLDHLFHTTSAVLVAVPVFFSSLVLLLVFGIYLDLLPVGGYDPSFPANLRFLVLPAMSLCIALVPVMARVVYSSVVRTNEEEFVETAIIHGLPARSRIWDYLLRPSLGPTIALTAYILGVLLGSAVLVERVFGLPGIGTELVSAVAYRDYPTVQGIVAVFGLTVVAFGFVGEIVSARLDHRMAGEPR